MCSSVTVPQPGTDRPGTCHPVSCRSRRPTPFGCSSPQTDCLSGPHRWCRSGPHSCSESRNGLADSTRCMKTRSDCPTSSGCSTTRRYTTIPAPRWNCPNRCNRRSGYQDEIGPQGLGASFREAGPLPLKGVRQVIETCRRSQHELTVGLQVEHLHHTMRFRFLGQPDRGNRRMQKHQYRNNYNRNVPSQAMSLPPQVYCRVFAEAADPVPPRNLNRGPSELDSGGGLRVSGLPPQGCHRSVGSSPTICGCLSCELGTRSGRKANHPHTTQSRPGSCILSGGRVF